MIIDLVTLIAPFIIGMYGRRPVKLLAFTTTISMLLAMTNIITIVETSSGWDCDKGGWHNEPQEGPPHVSLGLSRADNFGIAVMALNVSFAYQLGSWIQMWGQKGAARTYLHFRMPHE
jgi:hypothetical protein